MNAKVPVDNIAVNMDMPVAAVDNDITVDTGAPVDAAVQTNKPTVNALPQTAQKYRFWWSAEPGTGQC